jgi:hypothetical protein
VVGQAGAALKDGEGADEAIRNENENKNVNKVHVLSAITD